MNTYRNSGVHYACVTGIFPFPPSQLPGTSHSFLLQAVFSFQEHPARLELLSRQLVNEVLQPWLCNYGRHSPPPSLHRSFGVLHRAHELGTQIPELVLYCTLLSSSGRIKEPTLLDLLPALTFKSLMLWLLLEIQQLSPILVGCVLTYNPSVDV